MGYRGIDCESCANIVIKNITVDGLNLENVATFTVPVGILLSDLCHRCRQKMHCKKHQCENGFYGGHSDDGHAILQSLPLHHLEFAQ